MKKPGRTLEVGAKDEKAAVSSNHKTVLFNFPDVILLYQTGKELQLRKI